MWVVLHHPAQSSFALFLLLPRLFQQHLLYQPLA